MENLVSVQPHALDSHVPALCGPLQAGHPPTPWPKLEHAATPMRTDRLGLPGFGLHAASCQA